MINLSTATTSTLRERFVEDMTVRGFTNQNHHDYIGTLTGFAAFLGHSSSNTAAVDVRRFQIHQFECGMNLKIPCSQNRLEIP